MIRKLAITVLCLLLILVVAFWYRSSYRYDGITIRTWGDRYFALESSLDGLGAATGRDTHGYTRRVDTSSGEYNSLTRQMFWPLGGKFESYSGYVPHLCRHAVVTREYVQVPYWFVTVLLITPLTSLLLVAPLRRRLRARKGRCIHCGHELTQDHADCCPVCGAELIQAR